MNTRRQRRLVIILLMLFSCSLAMVCLVIALRQNINLYVTPAELQRHPIAVGQSFRLGGMVVPGSVHYQPGSLAVHFALTDYHNQITVFYVGVLPTLFREGQGIVAEGRIDESQQFVADQVLAKHDNQYRPPGLSRQSIVRKPDAG